MVGIELVTDRQDKTPAKAETAVLFEQLRGKQTFKANASNWVQESYSLLLSMKNLAYSLEKEGFMEMFSG